jgi:hypothetical protein
MLTPEAYGRLMKLLPKLAALTDRHRLKVLSDIDRVLALDGLTWTDIADTLRAPAMTVEDVLKMVEHIEQHPDLLSDNARSFIAMLRERATSYRVVNLSPRQCEWLSILYEQAQNACGPATAACCRDEGKDTLH